MAESTVSINPTANKIDRKIVERLPRLAVLDSLRGIAALIVVIHHCLLTQPAFSDFFFSIWKTESHGIIEFLLFRTPLRIVWCGYEAVTFFYVLSGFVLMLPWAEKRGPRYRAYATKRICRIYLPYCAAIAMAACLNAWLGAWADVPGASEWVRTMTWSHSVTITVLIDHLFMIGHYNTVDGAIHSLIYEMRVSLLFPLLAVPIARWRLRGAIGVASVLLLLIVALQLYLSQEDGSFSPQLDSTLDWAGQILLETQRTLYYCTFFVLGAVLAVYLKALQGLMSGLAGHWRLAMLIAGLLVIQGHWMQMRQAQAIFVAVGSAIVIVASLSPGRIERTLLIPPFLFLGKTSYSLYLVHVPILLAAIILLQSVDSIRWVPVAVPVVAIAAGWLFNRTIAEPSVALGQRLSRMSLKRAEAARA